MSKRDENDRLKDGQLNPDPAADAEPVRVHGKPAVAPSTLEPSDIPAEMALVGALLWAGEHQPQSLNVSAVTDILETGEAFFQRKIGDTYDAIRACAESGADHGPLPVYKQMVAKDADRAIGGLEGVRRLLDEAGTLSVRQLRLYAQSIRDAWVRRSVIASARKIAVEARDAKVSAAELAAKIHELATSASDLVAPSASIVSARDSAAAFMKRMMSGMVPAISTGLRDLDELLNGGLRPKEVTLIAARTNIGKSILSAQIGEHMASAHDDIGVLYVTLEMVHESFTARILSAKSGVPMTNIRRNILHPSQWQQLSEATSAYADRHMYFADSTTQTLVSIAGLARDASRQLAKVGRRLGLVVIDHLGLVKPSAERLKGNVSREQQVAETSRGQRFIATEFNCHVIGIAQINRESERDPKSLPRMSQLRDSGSLEQDADAVIILHRPRDPRTGMIDNARPTALKLEKGRMDEAGAILLDFDTARMQFRDYTGATTFFEEYGS